MTDRRDAVDHDGRWKWGYCDSRTLQHLKMEGLLSLLDRMPSSKETVQNCSGKPSNQSIFAATTSLED